MKHTYFRFLFFVILGLAAPVNSIAATPPTVNGLSISNGVCMVDTPLNVKYIYKSTTGSAEANSVVEWLVSDGKDSQGQLNPYAASAVWTTAETGAGFTPAGQYVNQYVKARVTPKDASGAVGTPVTSNPRKIWKLGATVSAIAYDASLMTASTNQPGLVPSAVGDGNFGTYWSMVPQNGAPYIQINLTSIDEAVNKIDLYFRANVNYLEDANLQVQFCDYADFSSNVTAAYTELPLNSMFLTNPLASFDNIQIYPLTIEIFGSQKYNYMRIAKSNGSTESMAFSEIKLYSYSAPNDPPKAENAIIYSEGQARTQIISGNTAEATYSYLDYDNDAEGATTYRWLTGSGENSNDYVPYPGAQDKTFVPTDYIIGKFLKCEITPVDQKNGVGTPVLSNAVEILGKLAVNNVTPSVSSLSDNGTLNAIVSVTNYDSASSNGVLIICIVNKQDGIIQQISSKSFSAEPGQTKNVSLDKEILLTDTSSLRAEIYVWSSVKAGYGLKHCIIVE